MVDKIYSINDRVVNIDEYISRPENGIYKIHYDNGLLCHEAFYKNGHAHGIVKGYRDNGVLEYEMPTQNGQAHGIVRTYYRDGSLQSEVPYRNGRRHGIARWYYWGGRKLKEKRIYIDDWDRPDLLQKKNRLTRLVLLGE